MTQRRRLLCIEDDARLRRLLIEDLEEAGYIVEAAEDAVSGAAAFFNHTPCLVLCDVRMPGISGFTLIERLRLLSPDLYGVGFLFLTALADRDNHLRGRRLGADDYIAKPVDYEILREVIRVRLAGRAPPPPRLPMSADQQVALSAWILGSEIAPPPGLQAALGARFTRTTSSATGFAEAAAPAWAAPLNLLPLGVVILDLDFSIHYLNESAAARLGQSRVAMLGRRLETTLAGVARRHAASGRTASAEMVALARDTQPVTVVARTWRAAGQAARLTLLLPEPSCCPPAMADLLQGLFDLTPAEQRLAADLGAGAQLADLARTRGVAVATLRSQLKSVFGKMGVSRQSDLVRALMSLQFAAGFAES